MLATASPALNAGGGIRTHTVQFLKLASPSVGLLPRRRGRIRTDTVRALKPASPSIGLRALPNGPVEIRTRKRLILNQVA